VNPDLTLLMIAYVYPPLAGSGVFRTLKFAKHLPQHGIHPVIVAADDPGWYARDEGLSAEAPLAGVYRVAPKPTLKRLQSAYRTLAGRAGSAAEPIPGAGEPAATGRGLKRRLLDRLGIPDEQVYWLGPATRAASGVLRRTDGPVCLYSTGPPFTDHLVGLELKCRTGLPWIADFRDAWAGNPVYMGGLDPSVVRRHRTLERRVVAAADAVLCAAPGIKASLVAAYPQEEAKIAVLTNGFDPDDFAAPRVSPPAERFVVSHLGELWSTRDPGSVLRAAAVLLAEDPTLPLELRFVGHRDPTLAVQMDAVVAALDLGRNVVIQGRVSHAEAVDLMRASTLLLFQSAFGPGDPEVGRTYPGKLFEYMAAERPVLGVVPGGDAAELIERTGCGWWRSPDDVEGIAALLRTLVEKWRHGTPLLETRPDLRPFDRRVIAQDLAARVRALVDERAAP